jgi:homoserine O-acetyltransferase
MKSFRMTTALAVTLASVALVPFTAMAADYPAPKSADWVVHDFKFHTGEVLPDLRLHYTTVGEPSGEPVLVLHGTAGAAATMLTPAYAGELFGPGQPLDATKYFIIIPDAIGHGGSSKPSDGLKTKFPKYDYDDVVSAQYRLLTEHLKVSHLRLINGNSMGGMGTWIWGTKYPDFMDALAPMASQPSEMSSRNWMLRRMLIEMIRNDPEYKDGNYTEQPRMTKFASVFFGIATSGGTLAYQNQAPTGEKADKIVDQRLSAPFRPDANDFLYQWESSHDYNPSANLEKITAPLLAINSTDDERNPPESGLLERDIKRVKNGRIFLIPASAETQGHGTTAMAKFYKQQLEEFLEEAPHRGM